MPPHVMTTIESPAIKRIALVAHDNMKDELLAWAAAHRAQLTQHVLVGTGTTGRLVAEHTGLTVERLRSGPLGGDQQLGGRIADGLVDILIFFWDPLEPQPHDPDIKALLRIAAVWNIPVACNRASADFILSSPLVEKPYRRDVPQYL
jgi:methylglyoxal synthase